MNNWQAGN